MDVGTDISTIANIRALYSLLCCSTVTMNAASWLGGCCLFDPGECRQWVLRSLMTIVVPCIGQCLVDETYLPVDTVLFCLHLHSNHRLLVSCQVRWSQWVGFISNLLPAYHVSLALYCCNVSLDCVCQLSTASAGADINSHYRLTAATLNVYCFCFLCVFYLFMAQCTVVQSEVLPSHVIPSVCDVGGWWSHRLEIVETNCTDN